MSLELKNPIFEAFIKKVPNKVKLKYSDSEIKKLEIDNDEILADVKGTKDYLVVIKFDKTQILSAKCTCPYDYGLVCKHIVNVLVHADQLKNENKSIETLQEIPLEEIENIHPYEYIIPEVDFSKYDTPFIFKHSKGITQFKSPYNLSLYHEVVYLNHLELGLDFQTRNSPVIAYFIEEENVLKLYCRCNTPKDKMCEHQAQALYLITQNDKYRIFFDKKIRYKLFQKEAYKYGIESEPDLDVFFDLIPTYYNFEIKLKKKGLVPVDNFSIKRLKDVLIPKEKKVTDLKREQDLEFAFVVFSYSSKSQYLEVGLYGSSLTKDGKIKNPLKVISVDKAMLSAEKVKDIKFYAAINQLSDYRYSSEENFKTEINAIKEIIANPLGLPFYKLNNKKSDNITANSIDPIQMEAIPIDFSLKVEQKEPFFEIKPQIFIRGRKLPLSQLEIKMEYFIGENGIYYLIDTPILKQFLVYFKKQGGKLIVHQSQFDVFNNEILEPLASSIQIEYSHIKKAPVSFQKEFVLNNTLEKIIYISEEEDFILLTPVFKYGEYEIPILSKKQVYLKDSNGDEYLMSREIEEEYQMIAVLQRQCYDFSEQEGQEFFYLSKRRFLEEGWFLEAFEQWRELGYQILGFNSIKENRYNQHKAKVGISVASGIDWFDTSIEISFGNQLVPLKQLQKAVKNRTKFVSLNDGTLGILPQEWINKFAHYFRGGEVVKDHIRTSKINFTYLDEVYDKELLSFETQEEIKSLKEKIQSFKSIKEVDVPKGLNAELRSYQKEGVNWLCFLDEFNFGGCLADDMGLGKTIQIIAFILHQRKNKGKNTNLVVVPTSLIFNWQQEIKKFAPSLKVHTIYGAERERTVKGLEKYEVILTSYGTLLSDVYYLKEFPFNYIFLDESQAIKNPDSQRYKSVRLLQSRNKIVMTGTPIENNTFDLFAQFSFACPGLLGTQTQFKEDFAIPIDKYKDLERSRELQRRINPFVLRRTKAQVATELPDKTEIVLYCEMGKEQRDVYESYKKEMRDYLKATTSKKKHMDTMYMLAALTKLRQICNSPALLNEEEYYGNESAKINVLLQEIREKHKYHKILVFSQFVGMLDLIKLELEKENIAFSYLTGQSKNREQIVEEFQENDEIRVFLISLKAGGTGLNLTEADYVYLVDPWWNPAVENQAIDRCYRIGQDKHVIAVRLITPGTIEEKVVKLQSSKKEIASDLIQTDESILKSLSKEALIDLF
jgi:SNF2 family DNA or RNA helicase